FDECYTSTRPMSVRLLAVDLDGTLVRRDGSFDPRDLEAIRRARREGILVTLATGRLVTHTLHVARAIESDAPMVCGDGATIACGRTGEVLERDALSLAIVDAVLDAFAAHDVAPFVFSHGEIHTDARGDVHHAYVRGWTPQVKVHPS